MAFTLLATILAFTAGALLIGFFLFRLFQSLQNQAKEQLTNTFKALSAESLKDNSRTFLEQAKEDLEKRHLAIDHLVKPLKESLQLFDQKMATLEKERAHTHGSLTEQIKQLLFSQDRLQAETHNLVNALRTPQVRGQWGEMQLKRCVELAGMLEHCDFFEQKSVSTEETGSLQRPDMVVQLPGNRQIIVDAKAPLAAYLKALEQEDPKLQSEDLCRHARRLRDHLQKLGAKAYWKQFDPTPEFVLLFLPGEPFFSAALQKDPSLIEYGVSQQVILATPTTLIALLKAVSYGWHQETIAQEAKTISALGYELYERIQVMGNHFTDLSKNLTRTVTAYNKLVASVENRLLPTARKLQAYQVDKQKELSSLPSIEATTHSPKESAFQEL